MYSAAQNYANYAYAYYMRIFCVNVYVHTRVYVSLFFIPISFFVWSIVSQTKDLLQVFLGMKKALKRNLHIVKNIITINESYHISSFWSLTDYQNWDENWNSRLKSLF